MKQCQSEAPKKWLAWWQLSLLGIGCIIGTGFFLGSSIAIQMTGPSVLLSFILAAGGSYIVFDVLAKLTMMDPEKGSFRTYAKKAYGRWAGFTSGWVYWSSELLIMGSQLTALSIFSHYWFPDLSMWIFTIFFGLLGILVVLTGSKGFDRIENVFALMKLAAILMFVILSLAAIFGIFGGGKGQFNIPNHYHDFFPTGLKGLWSSLIYGYYTFGGIEIVGLLAIRLKNKQDIAKSGRVMLILLSIIYVISIGLVITMMSWKAVDTNESPFITALHSFNLAFVPHVFNGVLIIAGFSTMVASLYAITSILVTLAEDRDAPAIFSKKVKKDIALPAIGFSTIGLVISIIFAFIMPNKIYTYFTTAASLMLLYNWLFILFSSGRLIKDMGKLKQWIGIVLLFIAISGACVHQTSRVGFFISIGFITIIILLTFIMKQKWKKEDFVQS